EDRLQSCHVLLRCRRRAPMQWRGAGGAREALNLCRIFEPRPAFYSARHIHAERLDLGDRLGDVVGMQPARQYQLRAMGESSRAAPVASFAGPTGATFE